MKVGNTSGEGGPQVGKEGEKATTKLWQWEKKQNDGGKCGNGKLGCRIKSPGVETVGRKSHRK